MDVLCLSLHCPFLHRSVSICSALPCTYLGVYAMFGSVRFGSVRLCYAMLYFVQLLSFCSTSPLLSSAKPLSRPFSTTTTTTTTLLYLSSAARICTSLHYIVLQGVFTVNILTIARLFIRPISHRSAQSDHGDVIQIFAYWMRTDLVACGKQINSLRY